MPRVFATQPHSTLYTYAYAYAYAAHAYVAYVYVAHAYATYAYAAYAYVLWSCPQASLSILCSRCVANFGQLVPANLGMQRLSAGLRAGSFGGAECGPLGWLPLCG